MSPPTNTVKHTPLLPCPFCGWETPAIRNNADVGNAWVSCDRCGAQSGGFQEPKMAEHLLRDLAADEWNHRSPAPQEKGGE